MPHLDDDFLVDLAIGLEPEGGIDVADARHLAECSACSASLTSLRRTAGLLSSSDPTEQWERPTAATWASIVAEVEHERLGSVPTSTDQVPAESLSTEPVPAEQGGAPLTPDRPGRGSVVTSLDDTRRGRAGRRTPLVRQVPTWLAGAAAAGLVVGLLTGRSLWNPSVPTPAPTVASVRLDTLDTKRTLGEASVLRTATEVDLRVQTEDLQASNGYLEVWLINRDGKRMVSIGVLGRASSQTFVISQELIDQGYVIVDISREGFDDKPQHSGDSLVRGTLPI